MTPIEKNMIVVDEQGNQYQNTYPKRAKGLVKNGRARFLSENTICLACPPEKNLEDSKMEEQNININLETGEVMENSSKMTLDYVLGQIEYIQKNDAYLKEALNTLSGITSGVPGDVGALEKAKAIGKSIAEREETNRHLLSFYQKMYEDLKPQKQEVSAEMVQFQQMCDMLHRIVPQDAADIIRKSMQQLFVKPGAFIVE